MVYEVSTFFIIGFYVLGIIAVIAIMYMFQSWRLKQKVYDKKTKNFKMIAGIREADGFIHKYLVSIEDAGTTVRVKGLIYFLPKEKSSSQGEVAAAEQAEQAESTIEKKPPPPIMFTKYPEGGFGPKTVLRYEEWDEGNPEPIRGFYGRFVKKEGNKWVLCDPMDEGAIFVKNQLMITCSGLTSYKNQVQAAAMGDELQEMEARAKMWEKAMANMPSKIILYILLLLAILSPFIAGMLGY